MSQPNGPAPGPPGPRPARRKSIWRRILFALAALAVLIALVALGVIPRLARQRDIATAGHESPVTHPVVAIVHATAEPPTSELVLPGNILALYSATLHARVDGYIERRNVDIGSRVQTGQLLAVISAPEIDQQLMQARATLLQSEAALLQAKAGLGQSQANAELARITKERDVPLGQARAISRQTVDDAVQAHSARLADVEAAQANIAAAEANVKANHANVGRLEQLQSFERIVAPFDGIITERNIELGDLVNAGGANSSKPLYSLAQSGAVRIHIDVPQSEAVNIHDGQTATITVKERLGRVYTGRVVRNASALNDAARTLLTEVQIGNRDSSLLPGMYAEVKFIFPRTHAAFIVPTSSLIIDSKGMRLAIVTPESRIHFVPITIGRDLGIRTEILEGLHGSESIVASPSDLLKEGQNVEVR